MDEIVSTMLFCLSAITLTAAVCMRWRHTRIQDLEELLVTVRGLASLELELRLDGPVEQRLQSGINRTLVGLSKRLWRAEQRGKEWEKALDSIEDVVCVVDPGGQIVRANATAAKKLNVDIRQLIGQQIQGYINGVDTDPDAECPIAMTVRSAQPVVSILGRCHFGDRLKMTIHPIDRPTGGRLLIAVLRDIEDGDRRDDGQQLSRIAQTLPCAAVVFDSATNRATAVNPAFTRMMGYKRAGFSIDDLMHSDDPDEYGAIRQVAFKTTDERFGVELVDADGQRRRCRVGGHVRRRANGSPAEMLLTFEAVGATFEDETQRDQTEATPAAESLPALPAHAASEQEDWDEDRTIPDLNAEKKVLARIKTQPRPAAEVSSSAASDGGVRRAS